MMSDERANARIEALFHALPWRGAVPIQTAIQAAQDYRSSLDESQRALYDEMLAEGAHPSVAGEWVERFIGKEAHRMTPAPLEEIPIPRAS